MKTINYKLASLGTLVACMVTACMPSTETQITSETIDAVEVYITRVDRLAREVSVRAVQRQYDGAYTRMYMPRCVDIDNVKEGTVYHLPVIRTTTKRTYAEPRFEHMIDYTNDIICKEFGGAQ